MCEYCRLINAIDAYILKADDDLADMMDKAGFCDSKDSVKAMNKTEDKVSAVLTDQTERIIKKLKRAKSLQEARENIDQFFETDEETTAQLTDVFETFYSDSVQEYASSYMKETAGDMTVNQLRSRTKTWISEWSGRLSEMMQLTSQNQMGQLIERAVSDGKSVADLARQIMEAGLRNEEWRARRAARTEMLRAHSVARDEAIMQNPTVNRRRWRHSGTSKIEPRQNHVDMDGQIVEKDKPYTLIGRDGNTYHPRFPRDPVLPAGESVNCGCTEQAVVGDDILGMSLEEREALQQQIIDEDDGEWERELDARNRSLSGIDSTQGNTPSDEAHQSVGEIMPPAAYGDDFSDFKPLEIDEKIQGLLGDLNGLALDTGFEYGITLDSNGNASEPFTSNLPDKVQVKNVDKLPDGTTILHCHTNGTCLSSEDFRFLTYDNVDGIMTIAINGDVYYAKSNGIHPSSKEFIEVERDIRNDIDALMLERAMEEGWTAEEYAYMCIKEEAYRLGNYFEWDLFGGRLK